MSSALLISGGIESIALAFQQRPKFGITINYGQKSACAEIKASKQICKEIGIEYIEIDSTIKTSSIDDLFDPPNIGNSTFPDWIPFRNQLILTIGCMKCIEIGIETLMIGTVRDDEIFKDGTPIFYELLNRLISYQEGKIQISTPAINLSAKELVIESKVPLNILSWAHSCTEGNIPCGKCRSCQKYSKLMNLLKPN